MLFCVRKHTMRDMLGFDFMDPPPPATLISSLEQLYNLGALDEVRVLWFQGGAHKPRHCVL
jgi:HrpA-like RNA helicase